jgi:hypothetical protein
LERHNVGDGGQAISACIYLDVQIERIDDRRSSDFMSGIVPELGQWGGTVAIPIAIRVGRANARPGDRDVPPLACTESAAEAKLEKASVAAIAAL